MATCGAELQSHREQDMDMCAEQSTPEEQSLNKGEQDEAGSNQDWTTQAREDRRRQNGTGLGTAQQDETGWDGMV